LRAFAVVAWDLGGQTQVGTVQCAGVELFEEAVEDEAGEDRREGVALREAFGLEKRVEVALRSAEVAVVVFAVHKLEIGEERAELWLGEEDVFGTGT
jgi:hypothetical protein